MSNQNSCPVCASNQVEFLTNKEAYSFNVCPECEFIYLQPMPTQEELNELYTDKEHEAEATYNKASSRLRRAYIKLPRFFPYAVNKDCLDLGCGGGFIAQALSRIAKTSTGVDISQNAISYAQDQFKKPVFSCKSFTELLKGDQQYDFVYSSEVIEHVSDINLYMKVLSHLCRPSGHLYITTPDAEHKKVPDDIKQWDVFTPPVHVQFFKRKTATILFERYGFGIKRFYNNKKPGLLFLAQKRQ